VKTNAAVKNSAAPTTGAGMVVVIRAAAAGISESRAKAMAMI